MKVFKLKRVKIWNTLSIGNEPVEVQLDKFNQSLVTGTNGTSKTTIIESITFALTGKPYRDIKKGQLINSVNKKGQLVELDMEYNGSEYFIKRGQKPNIFEVIKDGLPIDSAASVKDFQSEFEQMIGMNYNSFKQIVALSSAGYTPFMELSVPNRRKLIEDLLNISIIADMDKLNKTAIRELMQSYKETDLNINHIQSQISTHEAYAEKQKKLSGDNINRLQSMYDEEVASVNEIKAKNLELNEKILNLELPEVDREAILNISERLQYHKFNYDQSSKVLNLYSKGGSCPTCYQQLSDDRLVEKIKWDSEISEKEMGRYQKELDYLKSKRQEAEQIQSQIAAYESEMATNKQIAIEHVAKAKKIKAALEQASKERVDNTQEILTLKDDLMKHISKKSEIMLELQRRDVITNMLKDTGIKSILMKRYIPLFNQRINSYLKKLEAPFAFEIDSEFNEIVKTPGREGFSYASFSNGERARINLSILFAWRELVELVSGVKVSCLFLDEIFDLGLDSYGIKLLNRILKDLKDTNVFVITHKEVNPDDYGQVITMRKVGRFSQAEIS